MHGSSGEVDGSIRPNGDRMDVARTERLAYDYLCHLEEAKLWIQACTNEEIIDDEFEESLRNGVYLAKLANYFAPHVFGHRKLFDADQTHFRKHGLHFRHTDNINFWLDAVRDLKDLNHFLPDTTDIYDKKNIPKLIYCLHALSMYLYDKGVAPMIKNLNGKAVFPDARIKALSKEIQEGSFSMPNFNDLSIALTPCKKNNNDRSRFDTSIATPKLSETDETRFENWVEDHINELDNLNRNLLPNYLGALCSSSNFRFTPENVSIEVVQNLIDKTNKEVIASGVNTCLESGSHEEILMLFKTLGLGFPKVLDSASSLYFSELKHIREDSQVDLSFEEISSGIKFLNIIAHINKSLEEGQLDNAWNIVNSPSSFFEDIDPELRTLYMKSIAAKFKAKLLDTDCPLLTHSELQECIDTITCRYQEDSFREQTEESFVTCLIAFQACSRGYLVRKRFTDSYGIAKDNLDAVVKIQSWWRMCRVRKLYWMYLKTRDMEKSAVKIQVWWRKLRAKQEFQLLASMNHVPLNVLRKYLHLFDISHNDYTQELSVCENKQHIVHLIRQNQALEKLLDKMDTQIGLLVRNRITLEEVLTHQQSLKNISETSYRKQGLKALNKDSKRRLELYQNMFYSLQTDPKYLARLLFALPRSVAASGLMERVLLSLFNYGSSSREEYLMVRLFTTSLKEEIRSKIGSVLDIVTGNPMVLEMVISFNRLCDRQGALRTILSPLIRKVLNEVDLDINTNPVEVYHAWINKIESQTGKPSGFALNVTQWEALRYPEVKSRIDQAINNLKRYSKMFLHQIIMSVPALPYNLKYIASVLMRELQEKFQRLDEKDVLKVVGHLVYYRFINPAIAVPESHGIIKLSPQAALSVYQRRNLASIAKILQFIATKKGFDVEHTPHLVCLNPFIVKYHETFKTFCRKVVDVEPLEVHYKIHQYSEETMITKPTVLLTVKDILELHYRLLEHRSSVCPETTDTICKILTALEEPSIHQLTGSGIEEMSSSEIPILLKKAEFINGPDNDTPVADFLIRAKQILVDLLRVTDCDTVIEILNSYEKHEATRYVELMNTRCPDDSMVVKCRSVNEAKEKLKVCLQELSLEGVVTESNGYQDLVNSLAGDVARRGRRRQSRMKEIEQQRATLEQLKEKKQFFMDQMKCFEEYIEVCKKNMEYGKKPCYNSFKSFLRPENGDPKKDWDKLRMKRSLKYTFSKLLEKGVIIEPDKSQSNTKAIKSSLITIRPAERPGNFEVSASLFSAEMDTLQLDIQELLYLQYEGVGVHKLSNDISVNVNLLLHLLNRKFYSKG